MNVRAEITSDHIRAHLIERAKAYAERANVSLSRVSEQAVRDSKFLANVQRGGNFTLRTYQRVIDWLDEQEKAR